MADPAFRGFVETTLDALLVLEGCRRGFLPKITRRLQEFEKRALVVSGAVFVFHEEETGIKRWTDGLSWSPSRTLDNFLVYRELDKKGSQGRQSDAGLDDSDPSSRPNRSRLVGPLTSKADPVDGFSVSDVSQNDIDGPDGSRSRANSSTSTPVMLDRARERALVGSLTSSSRFHADGLVKKTISLSGLHLVSYYRIDDVTSGRLRTPSSHAELMSLEISPSFLAPSLFRLPPVVEIDTDGHVRYKGDADTPMSPRTRASSSPGAQQPGGASRPRSSGSASNRLPLPPPAPSSWNQSGPQGPQRRSLPTVVRTDHRYSPYDSNRVSQASPTYPPASNTMLPTMYEPLPLPRPYASGQFDPSSLASSSLPGPPPFRGSEMPPNYAPFQSWQRFPGSTVPGFAPVADSPDPLMPMSPSFYQPRHSVPNLPTPGSATNEPFGFNNAGPHTGTSSGALPFPSRQPPRTADGDSDEYRRVYPPASSAYTRPYGEPSRRPTPIQPWVANGTACTSYPHDASGNLTPFATPPTSADPSEPVLPLEDAGPRWTTSQASYAPPVPAAPSQQAPTWDYARYPRRGSQLGPNHMQPLASASAGSDISPHTPTGSHLQRQQQAALEQLYPYGATGQSDVKPFAPVHATRTADHAPELYGIAASGHGLDTHASGLVQPAPQDTYGREGGESTTKVANLAPGPHGSFDSESVHSASLPASRPASRFASGPGFDTSVNGGGVPLSYHTGAPGNGETTAGAPSWPAAHHGPVKSEDAESSQLSPGATFKYLPPPPPPSSQQQQQHHQQHSTADDSSYASGQVPPSGHWWPNGAPPWSQSSGPVPAEPQYPQS